MCAIDITNFNIFAIKDAQQGRARHSLQISRCADPATIKVWVETRIQGEMKFDLECWFDRTTILAHVEFYPYVVLVQ